MTDYQRIVDDIRTLLASDKDPEVTAIESLHGEHEEAVKEVNRRLRLCDELLQRGLRSEAIQQSETEPNLLDSVAVLDFAEVEQWGEFACQNDLSWPAELLADVAHDLNQAYALEQPLANLMRLHRLHALARSPLRPRIDVMRRIASLDSDNPVWHADIRRFEKARHDQLAGELSRSRKHADVTALAQLEQEATAPDWLEPPPKPIVDKIVHAHTQERAKHARQELQEIEQELTQAFSHFDAQAARKLRARWNARAAIGISSDDDPLLELVAPAMDWLDKQDQAEQEEADYKTTLADLQRALDEGAAREELERLYHALVRLDRGVPNAIETRLAERVRSIEAAEIRKSRMILVSVVLVVLLAAGGTGWAVIAHLRQSEREDYARHVSQLVEAGKLLEADEYMRELLEKVPQIAGSPDLQRLLQEINSQIREQQLHRELLAQQLANVRSLVEGEPDGQRLQTAEQELRRIEREICRNDEDRAKHAAVVQVVREARQVLEAAALVEFNRRLTDFQQRFEEVDRSDLQTLAELLNEGGQLQKTPHIPSSSKTPLDSLLQRLKTMRDNELSALDEATLLGKIDTTIGDRDRFVSALKTYAEKYPNRPRSGNFERFVTEEAKNMAGVLRWNALIAEWSSGDLNVYPPNRASETVARADELLEAHGNFPTAADLRERLPYLRAVAARWDESGGSITTLLSGGDGAVLENNLLKDINMVRARRGGSTVTYYFRGEPKPLAGKLAFSWYQDTGKTVAKDSVKIDPAEILNQEPWTAPQTTFRQEAIVILRDLRADNWEVTFARLMHELDQYKERGSRDEMDPILSVTLYGKILAVGSTGSECLATAFANHRDALARRLDLTANWLDPEDANASLVRTTCRDVLNGMPSAENTYKEGVMPELRKLDHPVLGSAHTWVAWLNRDDQRRWVVHLPDDAKLEGSLYVLHPLGERGLAYTEVGVAANGRVTMAEQLERTALMEGRPVYVRGEP